MRAHQIRVVWVRRKAILLRSAGEEEIPEDLKPPRLLLPAGAGEGVPGRPDYDFGESRLFEHQRPACTRQATGDSSGPEIYVTNRLLGHRLAVGDIRELEPAAGTQHTADLREDLTFVGAEIDDAVADHDVGPSVLYGQFFGQPFAEVHIGKTHGGCSRSRFSQHLLRHIDTDHGSRFTHVGSREEAVEAAP